MAQIQLYAKKQDTGVWTLLDLHASEPIKLTLSVQNIIDPTATTSVFSRTFKVPHTSVNGPFFEGVFNVNSMDFDASKKADAYIMDNGLFYVNGNITLNAIYSNEADNSVEYEITFYGATSDFGTKIGGGFLNEVNLNEYNHTKDYSNIVASWTNGLFNGDVVYGLIEWGYTYNKNNQPNIPTLSANFPVTAYPTPAHDVNDPKGSFTNPSYPYLLEQFKPQIRAKALWDKIFEESGYTYESDFLDSQLFKNLYVISENIAEALLDNSNIYQADNQQTVNQYIGYTEPWLTPHEIADPGANFNPNLTTYTAPSTGQYDFLLRADNAIFVGPPHNTRIVGWEARLIDDATGNVLSSANDQLTYLDGDQNPDLYPGQQYAIYAPLTANLTAGQIVRYEMYLYGVQGIPSFVGRQLEFVNQYSGCSYAPNIMSFNAIMPANIRKIDFMKSIINRFKLVFVPSKTQANHFKITPWKDWILEGRTKDWTDKLDTSKDMVIKPLFFDQERFQIWKDQEDSDYLNYNYQLTYKQTYGQLNQDSTNELIKGTHVYQDQFAPTPVDSIGWIGNSATGSVSANDAGKFIIPHIAKDSQTNDPAQPGKREPIQPKLRLVFYNGLKTAPTTWYLCTQSYDPATYTTVSKAAQTQYPLMSQYSSWPVTNTTYDLNWTNKPPFWSPELTGTGAPGKAQTALDTFNVYWKTWYDVTFDPYSRLVEANFVIDYGDTYDLQFNDYVWVKDAWYFVNEVKDYVVGQKTNVRAQLIKLGNNIGVTVPVITPPTYNATLVCTAATACDAYCCNQSAGATQVTVFPNAATLATSTLIYGDQYGSTFATPGIYSDASGTVQVSGTGVVTVLNTSACTCVPTYYTFTVYKNSTGCDVCCNNGPTVTVYGASPIFESNSALFTDTLLTIGAGPGYYKANLATVALQVGTNNGSVVQSYLCSTCQCTQYYPFSVCTGTTNCAACCCTTGSTTVYGTDPTFASNTILYANNSGTTPVPNGWYKFNNTTVAQVTGGTGAVTAFGTCTSCSCTGPITFTYSVFQQQPGYSTDLILVQSTDGTNWTPITDGALHITATDLPLGPDEVIYKNGSVELTEGTYVRALLCSNMVGTTGREAFLIGGYMVDDVNVSDYPYGEFNSPGCITIEYNVQIRNGSSYNIYGGALGGVEPNTSTIIVGTAQPVASRTTTPYSDSFINPNSGNVMGGLVYLTDTGLVDAATPSPGFMCTVYPDAQVAGAVEDMVLVNNKVISIAGDNNSGSADGWQNLTFNGYSLTSKKLTASTLTGTFDSAFATNISLGPNVVSDSMYYVGNMNAIETDGTSVWVTGQFNRWGTTSTVARNLVKISSEGVRDTGFASPIVTNSFDTTSASNIFDMKWYGGKLYLVGDFNRYGGTTAAYAADKIIAINPSTGAKDSSFGYTDTRSFGYNSTTDQQNAYIWTIAAYNDKIYVGGHFKYYNNAAQGFIISFNLDGTVNTTFNVGTGFNNNVTQIAIDSTGIYVSGSFTTYKGNACKKIVKLGFDGAIDSTFDTNYVLGVGANALLLDQTGIYIGNSSNYTRPSGESTITSRGIAKIFKNGVLDTYFNPYIGFAKTTSAPTGSADVRALISTAATAQTLYPIGLYRGASACDAFCHTGDTPVTFYGNGVDLYSSTLLYSDINGYDPADTGIYSDGTVTYQIYNGIKELTPLNTSGCNCGGVSLLQYAVNYSSIDACSACCETQVTYVYSASSPWSTSTVLYTDQAGTTYAPMGYYSYTQGICLQVGDNGNVVGSSDCIDCQCGVTCASYWIRNTDTYTNSYSYRDCDGAFYYGEWSPGETLITPCMDIGTFMSTGMYKIIRSYYC